MSRKTALLIRLLALIAALAAASPVAAQFRNANAGVYLQWPEAPGSQSEYFDTGQVGTNVTMPPLSASRTTPTTTVAASASATAELGRLTGSFTASSATSHPTDVAGASGQMNANWTDVVTITGPPGAEVNLRLRTVVTAALSASPPIVSYDDCGTRSPRLDVGFQASPTFGGGYGYLSYADAPLLCGGGLGEADQGVEFGSVVGEQLNLSGSLYLQVQTGAGPFSYATIPATSAAVDATHTVLFYLDVLTPGASYTSASGTTYFSGAAPPPPPPVLPVARLSVSGTTFRSPDLVTIGIEVTNPAGQPDADLYAGALLPDGRTAVFLTGPSRFGGVGALPAPASFVPMQVVPNGSVVNIPELVRMPLPPTAFLPLAPTSSSSPSPAGEPSPTTGSTRATSWPSTSRQSPSCLEAAEKGPSGPF